MSVIMDFSMSNPLISGYFKGSDEYVPTRELLYIHSHPLVRPNFLSEIEVLINQASVVLQQRGSKSGSVNRLILLTEGLGKLLPILDDRNASEALVLLREIYKFCSNFTAK